MEKPIISVVVPAYNEEKYLPVCLEALTRQDFKLPYEIIVIDNNSTDKTAQIAEKFGSRVILEKNKGVIFAKQKGLLSSIADIVAVIDADMRPPLNWLSVIYENLQDKNVVCVSGPVEPFDGPTWHILLLRTTFSIVLLWDKIFGQPFYVMGSNVAFKKKALLAFGGYDINKTMGEDEFGILKKLKKSGHVIFSEKMINYASSRRINKGLLYFLYEMSIKYYLNYLLSSIFKKAVFKPFSDIR